MAESACDAALVGAWSSMGDSGQADGDVALRIDSRCQLQLSDRDGDHVNQGTATALHVGHDGEHGYLWVDAAWARLRLDVHQPLPKGDIMLVAYQIDHDVLTIRMPDHRAIAHRIIDGQINGEIRRVDGVLANRLLAPVDPAALRETGFFSDDAARFRRARESEQP